MSYNRLESPTQSIQIAKLQETSLEVWGREPRGSDLRQVQAYKRSLPRGSRGIEFDTYVIPDPTGHPHIASWSGERPGVFPRKNEQYDYVAISVFNFKNLQPAIEKE